MYYPLEFEPYTPSHHFPKGKADPKFRTKLKRALQLVERSVRMGIPFRAVVADPFYGEDEGFKEGLRKLGVGYVVALKPTHSWWHKEGDVGALWQAAQQAGWKDENEPGEWVEVERRFRDGHEESWWALEVEAGPYGPQKALRAVIVSPDPKELPDLSSWYLSTNLPAPASEQARRGRQGGEALAAADLEEVVRLYGLRMWVEQSYKQTKHSLGWSQYQVRSDLAIRRHWELVCCAFSLCWYAQNRTMPTEESDATVSVRQAEGEAIGQSVEEKSLAAPVEAACEETGEREKISGCKSQRSRRPKVCRGLRRCER